MGSLTMEFSDYKIYRAIEETPFHKVAKRVLDLTESGRDLRVRDSNGWTFLHHAVSKAEKFNDPRSLPVIYQLGLAGIDLNVQDSTNGDTALHIAMKKGACHRVLIALLRLGIDSTIKNNEGKIAIEILLDNKPPRWEEMNYWYQKFGPDLYATALNRTPDIEKVESMLKSWCAVNIYRDCKLLDMAELAEKCHETWEMPGLRTYSMSKLLKEYQDNNDLALAVLAGSPKRIRKCLAEKECDINIKDHSYRLHYQHAPEVSQPLLAAAWEQNNYDVIDALMDYKPDTSVLFSNHKKSAPKPLYFHLVSGHPRPEDVSIAHRVLRSADLTRKNNHGQTVAFEAIKEEMSPEFLKAVLRYGVNVADRDYKGRTLREYAEVSPNADYVKAVDEYVLELVAEQDFERLEDMVYKSYPYIEDAINGDDHKHQRMCDRLKDDRNYKEMDKFIGSIGRTQRHIVRQFKAVAVNDVEQLETLCVESCRMAFAQNKCGHNILHWALLNQQYKLGESLALKRSFLIRMTDSMLRTPLHYAYLLLDEGDDLIAVMDRCGEGADLMRDANGLLPMDYSKSRMATFDYNSLLKEVTGFSSKVYLRELKFDETLATAITEGDLPAVKDLIQKAGPHVDLTQYSQLLFDCISYEQPDIAAFLIKSGADPDIWKQEEECDPTEDDCALESCRHPVISLHTKVTQAGYTPLANYIDRVKRDRSGGKASQNASPVGQVAR